jgi:hypothetical protein
MRSLYRSAEALRHPKARLVEALHPLKAGFVGGAPPASVAKLLALLLEHGHLALIFGGATAGAARAADYG